jgi:hypothetical protein
MAKDLKDKNDIIVTAEPPTPAVEEKQGLVQKKQPPRYWVRLAVFLVPLILSEIMFLKGGRPWNAVVFPIAWVAFFYFQMKRGGWNIFKP